MEERTDATGQDRERHSTAADTADRPLATWQVEPCPSWCEGSHEDQEPLKDRYHYTFIAEIPMRLAKPVAFGTDGRPDWRPPRWNVHLHQLDGGGRPTVHMFEDDTAPMVAMDLRLDEAALLADALRDAIGISAVDEHGTSSEVEKPEPLTGTRHAVTSSQTRNGVAGLYADLESLLAGFTPDQRAEVLEAGRAAALAVRKRIVEDQALAAIPEPPACPSWCTATHDAVKGWGQVNQHGADRVPDSVEKLCSAAVGAAPTDDGEITVTLDRLAVSDCFGDGRWRSTFVLEPMLVLHLDDDEYSRLTAEQMNQLEALIGEAQTLMARAIR